MAIGGILGQSPAMDEYLPLSGGTMTGNLILNKSPTQNMQAATKGYVDEKSSEWIELTNGWINNNRGFDINLSATQLRNRYFRIDFRPPVQFLNYTLYTGGSYYMSLPYPSGYSYAYSFYIDDADANQYQIGRISNNGGLAYWTVESYLNYSFRVYYQQR